MNVLWRMVWYFKKLYESIVISMENHHYSRHTVISNVTYLIDQVLSEQSTIFINYGSKLDIKWWAEMYCALLLHKMGIAIVVIKMSVYLIYCHFSHKSHAQSLSTVYVCWKFVIKVMLSLMLLIFLRGRNKQI